MTISPPLRKIGLLLHVVTSIGWLGAVAGFLVLAILGLFCSDQMQVRSAYISMDALTKYAIVPLCLGSLVTGVLQSLGTSWGLFRHYWVLIKLLITLASTLILLIHTGPIGHLASVAAERALRSGDFRRLRIQLVVDAAAAIVALLVSTVLAVYKPRGLTPYGWRVLRRQQSSQAI